MVLWSPYRSPYRWNQLALLSLAVVQGFVPSAGELASGCLGVEVFRFLSQTFNGSRKSSSSLCSGGGMRAASSRMAFNSAACMRFSGGCVLRSRAPVSTHCSAFRHWSPRAARVPLQVYREVRSEAQGWDPWRRLRSNPNKCTSNKFLGAEYI